jgi:GNAT superfamily N-acetyltransferase
MRRAGGDGSAEHGLTAVRHDRRGGGIGTLLKRTQLAWASANGVCELVTWTQRGNESMRRVNERLGYVIRTESVTVRAPLPLPS